MFDTFDIIVPRLIHSAGLSTRHPDPEGAFRHTDSAGVYVHGVRIGSTLVANVAYSNVAAWTGSVDRADWDVVCLRDDANAAAAHDDTWTTFLTAVRAFLTMHPHWRITCESDCDQHPLEHFTLKPTELVDLLDTYRRTGLIAFWAEA